MKISMIAALTKDRVIGSNNTLPWHIPEDFKYFKKMTIGKPIIMGRKTFESLGNQPLPNRKNIIVTTLPKDSFKENKDVVIANSAEEALSYCQKDDEVMIIGGAKIYQQFLSKANRLYLSLIHDNYSGDTYFPDYTKYNWNELKREEKKDFTILILDKKDV